MKDVLEPLFLFAGFMAAVRYVDRRPFVRAWWARFAEETGKRRFWRHLRPERRLSIVGVAIVFACIALMAVFSGADPKPPFFLYAPLLIATGFGGLVALYGFALSILGWAGLRDGPY